MVMKKIVIIVLALLISNSQSAEKSKGKLSDIYEISNPYKFSKTELLDVLKNEFSDSKLAQIDSVLIYLTNLSFDSYYFVNMFHDSLYPYYKDQFMKTETFYQCHQNYNEESLRKFVQTHDSLTRLDSEYRNIVDDSSFIRQADRYYSSMNNYVKLMAPLLENKFIHSMYVIFRTQTILSINNKRDDEILATYNLFKEMILIDYGYAGIYICCAEEGYYYLKVYENAVAIVVPLFYNNQYWGEVEFTVH